MIYHKPAPITAYPASLVTFHGDSPDVNVAGSLALLSAPAADFGELHYRSDSSVGSHDSNLMSPAVSEEEKGWRDGKRVDLMSKEQIQRHNEVMLSMKQFGCRECGRSFLRKHDFKRHVISTHRRDQVETIQCDVCSQTFMR
ncbi:hypothetical protein HDU98_008168 [Podochytrium sp. JEL0797]|nr:hypothetical protein HDU98_008168 [Podochytrium sp. JEL0797]